MGPFSWSEGGPDLYALDVLCYIRAVLVAEAPVGPFSTLLFTTITLHVQRPYVSRNVCAASVCSFLKHISIEESYRGGVSVHVHHMACKVCRSSA